RMLDPRHDGADMVLGVVRAPAWRDFPAAVARRYLRGYRRGGAEHDHVHGANMGFRADAYWQVGGFRALATGEDVELAQRFEDAGLRIDRDAGLSVATSDRRQGRAPRGFAQHLRSLSRPGDPGRNASGAAS
ncbi:MAG: glycosyltransferase family 2 protein, partial [Actinomycetota bacterium]|nr:glycosyltransferase family 2 protein [Actinomycetota bacterium]